MTDVTVYITRKNNSFFASRAKPHLHPGDTFTLVNKTTEPMVFRLKSRVPFGSQKRLVEIGAEGKTKRKARRPAWTGSREFPYQVLMVESGRKAKGNSDPVIILDNP